MTLTSFTLLQTCPDVFADSPLLPCSSCYILFLFSSEVTVDTDVVAWKVPKSFQVYPRSRQCFSDAIQPANRKTIFFDGQEMPIGIWE